MRTRRKSGYLPDEHGQDVPSGIQGVARIIVRQAYRHFRARLGSDALEDCEQEIAVLLWGLRDACDALPPDRQKAYAETCVRRAAMRFFRQAYAAQVRTVPLFEPLGPESTGGDL